MTLVVTSPIVDLSGINVDRVVIKNTREIVSFPSSVREIVVKNSKLQSLPTLPYGLKILKCSDNGLHSLPELPPTLTHLYCSKNKLSKLPKLHEGLRVLECEKNPLVTADTLPSSLKRLFYIHPNDKTRSFTVKLFKNPRLSLMRTFKTMIEYLNCPEGTYVLNRFNKLGIRDGRPYAVKE